MGAGSSESAEVVYEPSSSFVEASNAVAFADGFGIESQAALVERATRDRDWFWGAVVDHIGIEFDEPYDAVRDDSRGPQFTRWYPGGRLNVARNVVDRHARGSTRDDAAVVWEGEPGEVRRVSFGELHRQTNRVANALRERGVSVGDTVGLYLPMVPEVVPTLYGCLKAGAIAAPVFSGFGAEAAATRFADADCAVVVTADGYYRRGEEVALKRVADRAVERAACVEHVIVRERLGGGVPWTAGRDEWWADAVGGAADAFETESLDASAEALLLYSSGTTGAPKGIVVTHAGALVQPAKEVYFNFDHKPDDRFFWLSDIGWMMGPWSLIGNHAFGGTVVLYEGAPDHPAPDRLWSLVERHGVTTFGVSPTAIRSLRAAGDEWLAGHDRSSLRLLGSTGEPWDEAGWRWFYERVGEGRCPVVNVSGGTEVFGCFLAPLPTRPLKPRTLGGPGLGMAVDILDGDGNPVEPGERGYLVATDSCPSMTKSLWSGDERYLAEYWSRWDDRWNHGDWASRDADGFWFLHGRADDTLNVAGRRVGPAELEDALLGDERVTQAAVVGVPDERTGTAVVAYVVADDPDDDLRDALAERVASEVGKPFRPRTVRFAGALPVTQSGKIVRRVVRAAHAGESVGDLSSVANPAVVDSLGGDGHSLDGDNGSPGEG